MREKIVLIDGHSILNRAFYGVPDLTNSEGLHTNAVYGFLNIMFKILDEEKPEYLTVTFDVHAPTFRHEMYQEYKGTRKPMAEELRQQVPVIKEVLKAMNIEIIEQAGLEADDLLGTISHQCEKRDWMSRSFQEIVIHFSLPRSISRCGFRRQSRERQRSKIILRLMWKSVME